MQAAAHKTIIERGSDFAIRLTLTDGVGIPKILTDFDVSMTIKYDNAGVIEYIQANGSQSTAPYSFPGIVTDANNGEMEVVVDKAITAAMDGKLTSDAVNKFSTEYNFIYSVDIIGTAANTEDVRVIRGKMAIRN